MNLINIIQYFQVFRNTLPERISLLVSLWVWTSAPGVVMGRGNLGYAKSQLLPFRKIGRLSVMTIYNF